MFCMEFILHEILKYKLNNWHVLIFLRVECSARKFRGEFGQFSKFKDPGG